MRHRAYRSTDIWSYAHSRTVSIRAAVPLKDIRCQGQRCSFKVKMVVLKRTMGLRALLCRSNALGISWDVAVVEMELNLHAKRGYFWAWPALTDRLYSSTTEP